jgi:hypothetical protein
VMVGVDDHGRATPSFAKSLHSASGMTALA